MPKKYVAVKDLLEIERGLRELERIARKYRNYHKREFKKTNDLENSELAQWNEGGMVAYSRAAHRVKLLRQHHAVTIRGAK